MSTTNLFADRRFLNQETYHSTAVVVGILERDEFDYKEGYRPFNIQFSISNCERSIHLSFDTETREDIDNNLHKLQQIEDVARGLREALEKEKSTFEKWLKIKNKKRDK